MLKKAKLKGTEGREVEIAGTIELQGE